METERICLSLSGWLVFGAQQTANNTYKKIGFICLKAVQFVLAKQSSFFFQFLFLSLSFAFFEKKKIAL